MWQVCLLTFVSLAVTSHANFVTDACSPQDEPSFDCLTGVSLLQSSLEVVSAAPHDAQNTTLLEEVLAAEFSMGMPQDLVFRHELEGHEHPGHEHPGHEENLGEKVEHWAEHELHEAKTHPFLFAMCFLVPVWFGSFFCWKSCLAMGDPLHVVEAIEGAESFVEKSASNLLESAGVVEHVEPAKPKHDFAMLTGKMHQKVENHYEWQKKLGRFLESPWISGTIIVMVLIDLCCVIVDDILEETDLLNPKYHEQGEAVAHYAHNIILTVLLIFMVEHCCALAAFGIEVFHHMLFVLDVSVVWVTYMADVVFGEIVGDAVGWLIVLRLWKVVALAVDIAELLERASGHAHDAHGHHDTHHKSHHHKEELDLQHST